MKSSDSLASACRHCRYYVPEGRRGGHCSQLSVSVRGSWTACSLSRPVFAPTWDFTKIRIWQDELSPTISELDTADQRETSHPIALESVARSLSPEKITA